MQNPIARTAGMLTVGLMAAASLLMAASETLLDNDQVRVIKAVDLPHQKSAMHEHKQNRVMIYLTAGRQVLQSQNGKKDDFQVKARDVRWSPAGGMHTSETLSDKPLDIIEVELKKEGVPGKTATAALDPVKVDPQDYKVLFDNSQVRVLRVTMAPARKVPLHEHMLNRVGIYLTDQKTLVTTEDGKTQVAVRKPNEVAMGAPGRHMEENQSDKPFEVIVVELKY